MAQDINIYCDESRYSNPEDPYLVIGAVKCPRERKRGIVRELGALKRNNGIGGGFGGEFGWKSVSRNKAAFYTALIDWFLATDDLRFRCVVANKENLWSRDAESAFYVVYHQLLCHWLVPPNTHAPVWTRRRTCGSGAWTPCGPRRQATCQGAADQPAWGR